MFRPTIDNARADDLAAKIAAFEAAGGAIQVSAPATFVPRPPRKEPKRKAQPKSTRREAAHITRYRKIGPDLIELFDKRGLTIAQICVETGEGKRFVSNCLQFFGYDTSINRGRKDVAEKELGRQLADMAKCRYTLRYAAQCLDITEKRADLLARRLHLTFRRA